MGDTVYAYQRLYQSAASPVSPVNQFLSPHVVYVFKRSVSGMCRNCIKHRSAPQKKRNKNEPDITIVFICLL